MAMAPASRSLFHCKLSDWSEGFRLRVSAMRVRPEGVGFRIVGFRV